MKHKHDRDVLLAIAAHWRVNRKGLSQEEIAELIGVRGNSTVQRAVERLRVKGLLRLGYAYERRGMRPTPAGLIEAGVWPAEETVEALDMGA
jgi:transposase